MKRLEIIVEGQTEKEFVNTVLQPYFLRFGTVSVSPICVRTSSNGRGGLVNYEHLRNDILKSLKSKDTELVVSMFVDYFRIPEKRMPEYAEWENEANHAKRATMMEEAIARQINDRRFVPYIQMHEFEALLYSSNAGFAKYWPEAKVDDINKIISIFHNPEEINTTPAGAPSKRLMSISPDYDKVVEGNIIALEIGIDTMMEKCPRFSRWINILRSKLFI